MTTGRLIRIFAGITASPDGTPGPSRQKTAQYVAGSKRPFSIIFHGAAAGTGTTFLAAEIAALFQSEGHRTAAIDTDLSLGSLNLRLDLPVDGDTFTIEDLLLIAGDVSEQAIHNAFTVTSTGVRLLPSRASCSYDRIPSDPVKLDAGRFANKTLDALSDDFDLLVIDSPAAWTLALPGFLSVADLVVLTTIPELPAVVQAKRMAAFLHRQYPPDKTHIVLNRSYGRFDTISADEICSFLGLPVMATLPEDGKRCRLASDEGLFQFSSDSALGRSIRRLAASIQKEMDGIARRGYPGRSRMINR